MSQFTCTKNVLLLSFILFTLNAFAQLPVCNMIYGKTTGMVINNFNPALPVSATNPKINTIPPPAATAYALTVSPILGSSSSTLTFYSVDSATNNYIYYNSASSSWVNTGHGTGDVEALNIAAGGGYIYSLNGSTGAVYKYNGTASGTLLITVSGFAFGAPYDLVVDCEGNFYVFNYYGSPAFLRKYNPSGILLKSWTVNNPLGLTVSPGAGFAIVGTNLYTDDGTNGIAIYSLGSDTLTLTSTTTLGGLSYTFSDDDFGCCSASVPVLPAVSISASQNNICAGTSVTFTATPSSGGTAPIYQWKVNGSPVGTGLTSYTYTPANGDSVTCTMTSSSPCASTAIVNSNKITMIVNSLPTAPTVSTPVNLCVGGAVTTLSATGTNLKWYTVASGGVGSTTAPSISTGSASTANFYVSQTTAPASGSCEGSRATIIVNVNALPAAPSVITPVNLCVGGPSTTLSATGANLKWYTSSSGGVGSVIAPTITTGLSSTTTYYVSQSLAVSSGACEGARTAITANVNTLPAAPIVTTPVNLCVGGAGTTLTATGTNLLWYTSASGGVGSTSAPSISTATSSTATYYVSQSLGAASGSCEGARAAITVNVNALPTAPIVTSPVNLCIGGPSLSLTATGTNLLWYTSASGGVGSITAPLISTGSASTATYYVSQSLGATSGACEGSRASITANVNALPAAPSVSSPINLCVGGPSTTLSATGTNLKWYTVSSGGVGSVTAPSISTGSSSTVTYYVSQTTAATLGSCEGSRTSITAIINALPSAPTVTTPVNLCVGGTATTLTAIGTNLLWYTTASGGVGSTIAPTIATGSASTSTYYVSQSLAASSGACEGARTSITANVNALPVAPVVSSPLNLCVGASSVTLTATGTNLLWYTAPSGGVGSSVAPIVSTATLGSTSYYVSQSLAASSGACEGTRAALNVIVRPLPTASISSLSASGFIFCKGKTVTLKSVAPTAIGWQWSQASSPVSGAVSDTVAASVTGFWGLRVTDLYGCKGDATPIYVQEDTSKSSVLSPTEGIICEEGSLLLTCNPGFLTYTFNWQKDGIAFLPATPTSNLRNVNTSGLYRVIVTNNFGCIDTTNTAVITNYPKPIKPIIVDHNPIVEVPNTYIYYQWYRNGSKLYGANKNTYKILSKGDYYVEVTDKNGCLNYSDTLNMNITNGIENATTIPIKLYPNPTQSKVYIESPIAIWVQIADMMGRIILQKYKTNEIDLSDYADGIYVLHLFNENEMQMFTEKIIKTAQ